jgi:hypothetical protein
MTEEKVAGKIFSRADGLPGKINKNKGRMEKNSLNKKRKH